MRYVQLKIIKSYENVFDILQESRHTLLNYVILKKYVYRCLCRYWIKCSLLVVITFCLCVLKVLKNVSFAILILIIVFLAVLKKMSTPQTF